MFFGKLLIIEDSDIDSYIAQAVAKRLILSEQIIHLRDGKVALDYLITQCGSTKTSPDLILLDIRMPGMNGEELLRLLQGLGREKLIQDSVVVTTSHLQEPEIARLQELGVRRWIFKPITAQVLYKILEEAPFTRSS